MLEKHNTLHDIVVLGVGLLTQRRWRVTAIINLAIFVSPSVRPSILCFTGQLSSDTENSTILYTKTRSSAGFASSSVLPKSQHAQ